MSQSPSREPRMLLRASSVLLLIDVQEKYEPHLFEAARVIEGSRRLLEGARLCDVPVLVTEQYPRGLGHTVEVLRRALPAGTQAIEKLTMSCLGEPTFAEALAATARRQVVVCGIEAHACVNQTVHDLIAGGYEVHLAEDAISARFPRDLEVALRRLEQIGARPSTVETVLLEWVRSAAAPEFSAIRRLIRDPLPGSEPHPA